MKLVTIVSATALALQLVACQKAGTRHSNVYASDGQWWKCDPAGKNGCDTGSLADLGLSAEERDYVTGTLAAIPWPPMQATPESVAAALGDAKFQSFISKQIFQGVGPGSSPERGISVYHLNGQVNMVHWYVPGRFLLVKQHPEPR